MAPRPELDARAGKLRKLFRDVLRGDRKFTTTNDARLFIEAVRTHESPALCVEMLVTSANGLEAMRNSVRADLSLSFLQSQVLGLLLFLSTPGIKALAEGQFLSRILHVIVNPPTVWDSLVLHFMNGRLDEQSCLPFAWLTHELLTTNQESEFDILTQARTILQDGRLSQSTTHATRELAYKIEKVLQLKTAYLPQDAESSPGGRHDNDSADFRDIAIYPTADELLSDERPFYRRSHEIFELPPSERAANHLDNQFRLLREDMLGELREGLKAAVGKKPRRRSNVVLRSIVAVRIEMGDAKRGKMSSLAVTCRGGLEELGKKQVKKRRRFLIENSTYLKHRAFGALFQGTEVYGFASIDRDLDLLCEQPPVVCLQFTDSKALEKTLLFLKYGDQINFILVDTPVFAYEPILSQLKTMAELPLQDVVLDVDASHQTGNNPNSLELPEALHQLVLELRSPAYVHHSTSAKKLSKGMDPSQLEAMLCALSQRVSAIQGPPGTGKSFTGARIVKALLQHSELRVMVITYTNHALDQFLEELLDAGIPGPDMIRLGSKSTDRTSSLQMPRQHRPGTECWKAINSRREEQTQVREQIEDAFEEYDASSYSFPDIMEFLEFAEGYSIFHDAFTLPTSNREQQWKRVGKRGKEVTPDYLFSRWKKGDNPGIFTKDVPTELEQVWDMAAPLRQEYFAKWVKAMIEEKVVRVGALAEEFNIHQEAIDGLFNTGKGELLRTKRVIACTTTAAAMQQKIIRTANPDVILVEEAGEILESHVLSALAPSVKQLILIGDHKQLRPKVNNYALTVRKEDGYDLDVSLFERLVKQGFNFSTLKKQHRMHPDISRFPRALTYPELEDDPKTSDRPTIDSLQSRVVFVNHEHPETEQQGLSDRRDADVKTSKQNDFEALMVLKMVKYLAQQGYGTDKMVVLTPYLGQLRLLRQRLETENDPLLNDLDASELIQAGLMTQAASKVGRRPLRISTIDNYQGEESDIVIASLTRSNDRGDIGFMREPERLNVLITRARNCLIMIGNMDTFMESKRGKETWVPFLELLKERSLLYDGFPVRCERHPEKAAILQAPEEFDRHCPDGGCEEPCGAILNCGQHKCKRRCHRVSDHSQIECTTLLEKTCDRQHSVRIECRRKADTCRKCIEEDKALERRVKRDFELEKKRRLLQEAYNKQLAGIQDDIDHQRLIMKMMAEEEDQKKAIAKQQGELEGLKDTTARLSQAKKKQASPSNQPLQETKEKQPKPNIDESSLKGAQKEWVNYKKSEGVQNQILDELMEMIGLEEVKQAFLETKAKVDTKVRQNVPLTSERFNCSLLGNPGTGKTTVARLYAKFLTSVGVLPGCRFEETTGSKLANMGVTGCQKLIDDMLNDAGGVIFIDEAYQLTSGNSFGGGGVLDFLLPEVENLTGKIVFVLAGYNKQMESFFAHNPGLPSRFPIEMKFADYTDDELLKILGLKISKQYRDTMKCEDGLEGLYCRIVARRVGRGRGREGFGNARTIENTLASITQRQATRLTRQRRSGDKPDDLLLTKEDLIGPKPSEALAKSVGWRKLTELIGLGSVKQAVKALLASVEQNYERELAEQAPIEYSLNKVFLGNPGTGKTTVAKLYGQILVDLALLSKGEVIVKNPSDFVGSALGQSEQQTKGILASCLGKVLVIDEAYGLYGGGGHQGSTVDPYKTSVIDTIVAEVQSVPGDDRCVLLLGYKEQLETMFQNVNPGLSRRFPIASAFEFQDFDDVELSQILDLKLNQQGFKATGQAKDVAMEMLGRARNRPNFGNAGEIDIILDATKARHQGRWSRGQARSADTFEAVDFDENFNRGQSSETDVRKLFEGTVGAEDVIDLLLGYQQTVRRMKTLDMDPKENIPFNFLFRGPPGTGKTTTARKMGKVFYDMGFLATAEVVECSATDLIGQYVGHTGPKVQQLLEKALGKVLFIDEAYRLADGGFATEAVNELVDSVTKDKFSKKLVIVLSGYEKDINRLMSINEGLTSRFPEVINFRSLKPKECMSLLGSLLANQKAQVEQKRIAFDMSALETPSLGFSSRVQQLFLDLSAQASWASARDVKTLGQQIFNEMIKSETALAAKRLVVEEAIVIGKLEQLFKERQARGRANERVLPYNLRGPLDPNFAQQGQAPPPAPQTSINTTQTTAPEQPKDEDTPEPKKEEEPKTETETKPVKSLDEAQRDAGVSDAVWEQLQRDRQAEQDKEDEYQRLLEAKKRFTDEARAKILEGLFEEDRQREEEEKAKKRAMEEARKKILERLMEEERRRKEEAKMREKLAQMGVCPMGYQWIKQGTGWRCAGGSHFMSNEQLQSALH